MGGSEQAPVKKEKGARLAEPSSLSVRVQAMGRGTMADDRERVRVLQRRVDLVGVVLHTAGEAGRGRLPGPGVERLVPEERDARGAVGVGEVVEGEVEPDVDDPDDGPGAGQRRPRGRGAVQLIRPGRRDGRDQLRAHEPGGFDELHLRVVGQRFELRDRQLDRVDALGDRRPDRVRGRVGGR